MNLSPQSLRLYGFQVINCHMKWATDPMHETARKTKPIPMAVPAYAIHVTKEPAMQIRIGRTAVPKSKAVDLTPA